MNEIEASHVEKIVYGVSSLNNLLGLGFFFLKRQKYKCLIHVHTYVVWKVLLFTHTAAIYMPGAVDVRKTVSWLSLCQGTILDRILTNNVISHSHLF